MTKNAKGKTTEEYLADLEQREKRCADQLEALEQDEKRSAKAGKDLAKLKAERRRLAQIRGLIKRIKDMAAQQKETPEKFFEQRSQGAGQEIEIPEQTHARRDGE